MRRYTDDVTHVSLHDGDDGNIRLRWPVVVVFTTHDPVVDYGGKETQVGPFR